MTLWLWNTKGKVCFGSIAEVGLVREMDRLLYEVLTVTGTVHARPAGVQRENCSASLSAESLVAHPAVELPAASKPTGGLIALSQKKKLVETTSLS